MAKRKKSYGGTAKEHSALAARWARTFREGVKRAEEALRYPGTESCGTAFTHIVNAAQAGGYYDAHQGSRGPVMRGQFIVRTPSRRRGNIAAGQKLRRIVAAYRRKCQR